MLVVGVGLCWSPFLFLWTPTFRVEAGVATLLELLLLDNVV
jgi:hypothetical protein